MENNKNFNEMLVKYVTASVRQSEQLRILKNYIKLEKVIVKEDVLNLITAMEAENE